MYFMKKGKMRKQAGLQKKSGKKSKVLYFSAALSLVSSLLVLFFFTSLIMYDKVCYFESKMEILLFEWLLAALVFIVSIRALYLLFSKKHEIVAVKK